MPASQGRARPLLILTALFLLSLPLVTTRIYASDEVQYFSYLRSLWFDRDVSFENEYQHFYDSGVVHYPGFHETFLERQTETGRRITFATMGSALLWSPFYAVADLVVRVRRAMGDSIAADGYSQPYVSAVAYGSAVYGWLSLVLSMVIARRLFADRAARNRAGGVAASDGGGIPLALVATVAVWIGTPLFFYMYIAPPMSHACSAFATALFVLVWLHVRERWSLRGLIVLGALAALLAMVREQDVFVAIGPAIDWLLTFARRVRTGTQAAEAGAGGGQHWMRLVVNAAAGVVAFAIAFTPQVMAYVALNGYPGPSRLVARKMSWMAPHALEVLGSPKHGLFFWTPLVLLSLAGLVCLVLMRGDSDGDSSRSSGSGRSSGNRGADNDLARIGVCLLLMVATQVYVAGSVESWTVAGAFGQRRFVGLSPIFAIGLIAFLRALPTQWPRRAALAVTALAVWWNLGLMAQFGAGLMDRQRLELGRNAYHNFVTIPRKLPDLAYRYVFERRSFFKGTA
jgi:preprotein translocase subunit SecG